MTNMKRTMTGAVPVAMGLNFIEACKKCTFDSQYVLQGETSFANNVFARYDKNVNSFILINQNETGENGVTINSIIDFSSKTNHCPLNWTVTISTATDTYSVYKIEDLIKMN